LLDFVSAALHTMDKQSAQRKRDARRGATNRVRDLRYLARHGVAKEGV
jgi:hypothetical protein